MAAQNGVVIALNEELLIERIARAQFRVCFVAPGLYDWVAEALIDVGTRIGWSQVDVVIDPDPFAIQVGYGTEEALKRLCESGACVRKAARLRLGLVITDDSAAIFTPIALNIEDFPKKESSPNAVELSVGEANRILEAVAPNASDGAPPHPAEIGQEKIAEDDLQRLEQALIETPPVAPNLARQMWVLNSQIQIVKITFNGAHLSQHRISLRAEQLGIEDAYLARRITGSFKLFGADIDQLLTPFKAKLERIKEVYGLKPIGDLGHVVLGKDRQQLENALEMFKKNLELAQLEMVHSFTEELDNSRKRLKGMLAAKVQEAGLSEAATERRLNHLIGSMKFPTADQVMSRIEFDWSLLNITSQMIAKESFTHKIQELYGRSIEELTSFEQAVGVRTVPEGKNN